MSESNPLTRRNRRVSRHDSAWVRSFSCEHLRPLIICRGPVRKEAMDIFEEMGIREYGILLSEKDSIGYSLARSPETRLIPDSRVHAVTDYSGVDGDERRRRMREIVDIARDHDYNSVFAGYGFMAEDAEMIEHLEKAGLLFIGPNSRAVRMAGFKDQAKRTALETEVSVVQGIDNLAELTLLRSHPDEDALKKLLARRKLPLKDARLDAEAPLEEKAARVLEQGRAAGVELFTLAELEAEGRRRIGEFMREHSAERVRLKAVGGGGGKGQRVLAAFDSRSGGASERLRQVEDDAAAAIREILSEVKATGAADNRNILIELNLEAIRHLEIQVVGNGDWCLTMGGRDCSLQMHEQKLVELSVHDHGLALEIEARKAAGREAAVARLEAERRALAEMEREAQRFGAAVGLNSVSTFECIATESGHYFMEMNTRIQVEHRVSELCQRLRFVNPDNDKESFETHALIELMTLLAAHGERLPRPAIEPLANFSVELRLNASDAALAPAAGGVISDWSSPSPGEIRDEQGICTPNPDTNAFMRYRISGAYDSNIALLLCVGERRAEALENMAEILRRMVIEGENFNCNLDFHRGILQWILRHDPSVMPDTGFVACYLAMVGELTRHASSLDLDLAWRLLRAEHLKEAEENAGKALAEALDVKMELLLRPLKRLLVNPHMLAGWLSLVADDFKSRDGTTEFIRNPFEILDKTYHFINMDCTGRRSAAREIWRDDRRLLNRALEFYAAAAKKLKIDGGDYASLAARLDAQRAPAGVGAALWRRIRASHLGFGCGVNILKLPMLLAEESGFFDLRLGDGLRAEIPERAQVREHQEAMRLALAPPPLSADEILAPSGGMFYAREAPDQPPLMEPGRRFESGEALCVIEVMKMFNKLRAPFSGVIERVLIDADGAIVRKGQPLFKVRPDQAPEQDSEEARAASRRDYTERVVADALGEAGRVRASSGRKAK